MKMNEVKSVTWSKLAEIKTNARTPKGIYNVLIKEFGVDFYKDVSVVVDEIAEGNIHICEDGIIIWGSWKEN